MTNLYFILCIVVFIGLMVALIRWNRAGAVYPIGVYIGILFFFRFMLPEQWNWYASQHKMFWGSQSCILIMVLAHYIQINLVRTLLRVMAGAILVGAIYLECTNNFPQYWKDWLGKSTIVTPQVMSRVQ